MNLDKKIPEKIAKALAQNDADGNPKWSKDERKEIHARLTLELLFSEKLDAENDEVKAAFDYLESVGWPGVTSGNDLVSSLTAFFASRPARGDLLKEISSILQEDGQNQVLDRGRKARSLLGLG